MEQKFQQAPRKQPQLKFPVHISHGAPPADGNIIILTKYFSLCMSIQRASVAFSLQDWHILYCPRTFMWSFRGLDLVEWSCIHSIMSLLTFLKRALFGPSLFASSPSLEFQQRRQMLELVKMVYLDHINENEPLSEDSWSKYNQHLKIFKTHVEEIVSKLCAQIGSPF